MKRKLKLIIESLHHNTAKRQVDRQEANENVPSKFSTYRIDKLNTSTLTKHTVSLYDFIMWMNESTVEYFLLFIIHHTNKTDIIYKVTS